MIAQFWRLSLALFWILATRVDGNESTLDETEKPANVKKYESTASKLTNHLLSQHNKHAAPDGVVDVHYELELVHILKIDELKQTLSALVYVDEKWTDPSLQWDPNFFNNTKKTWLPMASLWLPDIIIFNMLSASRLEFENLLSGIQATVLVYSNGTVEYSHPSVYTVSCEINIKHFPLDDQKCALEIASWSYGEEKIRLVPHSEHNLQHYTPNEEWQLLNVSVQRKKYEHEGIVVNELFYEISVRRKPLFYFITVTIPSYVMCVITVIGVFARASTTSERIERFTLGVMATITTTSTAVLSLVVSEKVPHSSTAIPLLVAYFLYNMVILSVAVVLTSAILRIHRKGRFGAEPPLWAMNLLFLKPFKSAMFKAQKSPLFNAGHKNHHCDEVWTQDLLTTKTHRILLSAVDSDVNHKLHLIVEAMNNLCNVWKGVRDSINSTTPDQELKEHAAERNGFVRIADRLDWVFMILFITLLTIPVIYLYVYL
ncbi:unnamed protein product [Bursaphelenchus xylophilus]|uniref:(pine wood nematode) hypothetical protein n=1 Tax=Bursaphelenchus xylophilus TaxID=6326 RepID=A0A1I7S6K2_BURXY|nr:unnamed protein product [Bursaphelenchus xylophilus]CAG9120512.1 unnamed protein product [Bursaphelenchus xylophilus]